MMRMDYLTSREGIPEKIMLTLSVQLGFLYRLLYSDLLRTLLRIHTSALSSRNFRSVIRYQCDFDIGVAVCNITLICRLRLETFDRLARKIFSLCIKYYSVIICGNDGYRSLY